MEKIKYYNALQLAKIYDTPINRKDIDKISIFFFQNCQLLLHI